jgi:hypothetical protein
VWIIFISSVIFTLYHKQTVLSTIIFMIFSDITSDILLHRRVERRDIQTTPLHKVRPDVLGMHQQQLGRFLPRNKLQEAFHLRSQ